MSTHAQGQRVLRAVRGVVLVLFFSAIEYLSLEPLGTLETLQTQSTSETLETLESLDILGALP